MKTRILLGVLVLCVIAVGVGRVLAVQRAYATKAVRHGEYLVDALAACGHCHTPLKDSKPDTPRLMAGGAEFKGKWGVDYAANLTPDPETGLGRWTDDQIVRSIRDGVDHRGQQLLPPMPFGNYHRITDGDVDDIVAYLRSLRPVYNQVLQHSPAQPEAMR